MRKRIIQLAFMLGGAAFGITFLPILWDVIGYSNLLWVNNPITDFILGALIFFLLSLTAWRLVDRALKQVETILSEESPLKLLLGSLSMMIGLVLAVLITSPLRSIQGNVFLNAGVPILVMLAMGYLGYRIGTGRMEDVYHFVGTITSRLRIRSTRGSDKESDVLTTEENNYHHYKILDTNILIDGRILELVKTGWIEGTLLVPNFVLYELQYIADAGEPLKRVRGRRGLDILNELRRYETMPLEMWDGDYEDIKEVDEKLIRLAQELNGILVTNDFNLNKVTRFQNVEVLNLNALAGALRTSVAVGEHLEITLVKNGRERQQAIGYLDDGTMVVVEDGQTHLQETVAVEVTSSLQTDAGRMIFGNYLATV
ncbi:PIN domain nuclease [Weissella diestrammenae]|uniref:PIN domain nuclease n=1 Tax=Weissella diestrammenae TaxID=1162633 RepID=A0A7G9T3T1_9LACO|nr:PIN domain-containing protein [Weissella diestrammenae]MCM0582741.1 PIN domain nuclease [Weissella diestrammenae]QNN74756.1 PIN domain nuclease [Weissella diestrammenae]